MSEEIIDENAGAATGERPTFLTVICILSFIAAGLGIVFLLLATVLAGAVTSAVGGSATGSMWGFLLVAGGLIVASLIGVIKMWKLQKQGFMIYAGAGVAGLIVEATMGAGFNLTSLVITGAFIAMYYVNLKHMS